MDPGPTALRLSPFGLAVRHKKTERPRFDSISALLSLQKLCVASEHCPNCDFAPHKSRLIKMPLIATYLNAELKVILSGGGDTV